LSSPVTQASGQINTHILQAIQSFCKNFGLESTRQEPVLFALVVMALEIIGPNIL